MALLKHKLAYTPETVFIWVVVYVLCAYIFYVQNNMLKSYYISIFRIFLKSQYLAISQYLEIFLKS